MVELGARLEPRRREGREGEIEARACEIEIEIDREAMVREKMRQMDRFEATKAVERGLAQLQAVLPSLTRAARHALANSPRLHVELVGARLTFTRVIPLTTASVSPGEIETAVGRFVSTLLRKREMILVEPYMLLEVLLADIGYLGDVMKDLTQMGAVSVLEQENGDTVEAIVAMRNLTQYSARLRRLTKGHAQYWYKLDHYRKVDRASRR